MIVRDNKTFEGTQLVREVVAQPLAALLEWAQEAPRGGACPPKILARARGALWKLGRVTSSVDELFLEGAWAPFCNPLSRAIDMAQAEGWRAQAALEDVVQTQSERVSHALGQLLASLVLDPERAGLALQALGDELREPLRQALESAYTDGDVHGDYRSDRTDEMEQELYGRIEQFAKRLVAAD